MSYYSDYRYAKEICESMAKSYPAVPEWMPLSDLMGVLTQIDNMWCGFRDRIERLERIVDREGLPK